MSVEIERKFLVSHDGWMSQADEGRCCKQGYIVSDSEKTVRIRVMDDAGFLTVKGATNGISRMEFEYKIDRSDAEYMLRFCDRIIDKTRYNVEHTGMIWEVDVFHGDNTGLIIAEIELTSEKQPVELPDWVGKEVSGDPRYYNACLARNPFSRWQQ